MATYKPLFSYFGGKSRIAEQVWKALGDPSNYVEPFFGSGAVLFMRPRVNCERTETVNDADGMVANFWRATQADPAAVAKWADWPVNDKLFASAKRATAWRILPTHDKRAYRYASKITFYHDGAAIMNLLQAIDLTKKLPPGRRITLHIRADEFVVYLVDERQQPGKQIKYERRAVKIPYLISAIREAVEMATEATKARGEYDTLREAIDAATNRENEK